MSEKPPGAELLPTLANGINTALYTKYGKQLDFVLVVAVPDSENFVQLSTVTGITDPSKLLLIARHLHDMAEQQQHKPAPDDVQDTPLN